jgi:TonB family protein
LTLFATVSFSLAPEGIVSSVRVERSSGYSDVDAAVTEAIRRWRFSAAKGARVLKGKVPYTITAR